MEGADGAPDGLGGEAVSDVERPAGGPRRGDERVVEMGVVEVGEEDLERDGR